MFVNQILKGWAYVLGAGFVGYQVTKYITYNNKKDAFLKEKERDRIMRKLGVSEESKKSVPPFSYSSESNQ
ncbi:hypothetical protein MIR68_008554 [Amoeboaphelidium protococcarum]|nr:hypothetical protein MIR68_008554 [Amoeboaphelidium protococcarum]KAI3644260.1 hypothetical protein MP228_010424 [Amoeboaphelidium protococcarum]